MWWVCEYDELLAALAGYLKGLKSVAYRHKEIGPMVFGVDM